MTEQTTTAARRLTRRHRRSMGLTVRNIARVTRQLKEADKIDDDMSQSEIAVLVVDTLTAENPKAYQEVGVDWDAILDFIERLLPIILQFIDVIA